MITLLLATTLSCSPVTMVNNTTFPWNKRDLDTLASAKKGCSRYYKRSPCVKIFTKTGQYDYRVICTRPVE